MTVVIVDHSACNGIMHIDGWSNQFGTFGELQIMIMIDAGTFTVEWFTLRKVERLFFGQVPCFCFVSIRSLQQILQPCVINISTKERTWTKCDFI